MQTENWNKYTCTFKGQSNCSWEQKWVGCKTKSNQLAVQKIWSNVIKDAYKWVTVNRKIKRNNYNKRKIILITLRSNLHNYFDFSKYPFNKL